MKKQKSGKIQYWKEDWQLYILLC